MASNKHHRDESPTSDSGSAKRSRPWLARLWTLPQELQDSIWSLVCARPPSDDETDNSSASDSSIASNSLAWQLNLDLPMVASLTIVSRYFYSLFNPLLYRHVRLTRPSTLLQFHAALESRPSNGLLVHSLQLGELEGLADGWWPCWGEVPPNDPDDVIIHFKTSLTVRDEVLGLLPRWCEPEQSWAYAERAQDCHDRAISEALVITFAGMKVHSFYNGFEFVDDDFEPININAYTISLFRAQAVLDLYLGEMRRRDDATKPYVEPWQSRKSRPRRLGTSRCREGRCGHYPKLRLTWLDDDEEAEEAGEQSSNVAGGPVAASPQRTVSTEAAREQADEAKGTKKEDNDLTLTVAQVETHLFRPGGFIDHFDHPLRYALAGVRTLAVNQNEQVVVNHHTGEAHHYYSDMTSDSGSEGGDGPEGDGDSDIDAEDDGSPAESTPNNSQPAGTSAQVVEHSEASEAPLGGPSPSSSGGSLFCDPNDRDGILTIAHHTLQRLSKLKNLSLTGIFGAILGPELCCLDSLRFLSIGPLSPPTDVIFAIDKLEMPLLEKLRICGDWVSLTAIRHLSGEDEMMPSLREVVWDTGRTSLLHPANVDYLEEALAALQGRHAPDGPVARGLQGRDYQPQQIPQHRRGRLLDVRLHPIFFSTILEGAPSTEVREAWLQGLPTGDDPHSLRISKTQAANADDAEDRDEARRRLDLVVFRRDSKQWWEARALELAQAEEPGM